MRIDEGHYVTPTTKTVEIKIQAIICQSMNGSDNESYEEGGTEGWF